MLYPSHLGLLPLLDRPLVGKVRDWRKWRTKPSRRRIAPTTSMMTRIRSRNGRKRKRRSRSGGYGYVL